MGHTFDEVAAVRGDYDRWFREGLGVSEEELEVLRVYDGAPLPAQFNYDGIVVTGSWSMVTDREPWSEATAEYLRAAAELERPILGVCYGHQLLAHAFGGLVGYNPVGRNVGIERVVLTEAAGSDPLFQGFTNPLQVYVSHSQRVIDLPAEAVLLGRANAIRITRFESVRARGACSFIPSSARRSLANTFVFATRPSSRRASMPTRCSLRSRTVKMASSS